MKILTMYNFKATFRCTHAVATVSACHQIKTGALKTFHYYFDWLELPEVGPARGLDQPPREAITAVQGKSQQGD